MPIITYSGGLVASVDYEECVLTCRPACLPRGVPDLAVEVWDGRKVVEKLCRSSVQDVVVDATPAVRECVRRWRMLAGWLDSATRLGVAAPRWPWLEGGRSYELAVAVAKSRRQMYEVDSGTPGTRMSYWYDVVGLSQLHDSLMDNGQEGMAQAVRWLLEEGGVASRGGT